MIEECHVCCHPKKFLLLVGICLALYVQDIKGAGESCILVGVEFRKTYTSELKCTTTFSKYRKLSLKYVMEEKLLSCAVQNLWSTKSF